MLNTIRELDLAVQSLLLLAAFTTAVGLLWGEEMLLLLMWLQALLGAYQVLGALVQLYDLSRQEPWFQKAISRYLIISIAYLLAWCVLAALLGIGHLYLLVGFSVVPPWGIAAYYYTQCWKKLKAANKSFELSNAE